MAAWANRARSPFALVLGFGAAAASVIGVGITAHGSLRWTSIWLYLLIVAVTPAFAVLFALLRWLVERPRRRPQPVWRNRPRSFFFDWVVIWAAWVPVWLSGWPGFWCYDARIAYQSAREGVIDTALPPLHTFLATGVEAQVAAWTGHHNYGIAAWTLLQSLVVAGVFAFTLRRLRAWRAPRVVRWGSLAYFALFPTIALFSLNWARNTLYSALVLALAVCVVDAVKDPRRRRWWLIGLLALAAVTMRRDAIYVFAVIAVVVALARQPARKALAICFGGAAIVGALIDPVVYRGLLDLAPGSQRVAYSLPLQQLARVYNDTADPMTPDQRRLLEWYVSTEALEAYRPQLADPVFVGASDRRLESGSKGLIRLWARVGLEHPRAYADALAAATVQGWLPGAVIDAYSTAGPAGLYPTTGTSYFCYATERPGTATPKGPAFLHRAYAAFSHESRVPFETPIVAWLWSPGTYLWVFVFAFGLSWAWNRRGRQTAFWPVGMLVLATCVPIFAGPAMLVRYFLALFYCLPLVAAFLIDPRVYALPTGAAGR
jgi:hypothetical protein